MTAHSPAMHPMLRMASLVGPAELAAFLRPETLAATLTMLRGRAAVESEISLDERDPDFVARFLDGTEWIGEKWFRHRALGLEHIPRSGPALLVGNHNGVLFGSDWALAMVAVRRACGPGRVVYGLGHDILQLIPALRPLAAKLGGVRAGHHTAHQVFARGHLASVYPGSEYDSCRPFGERNRIVFAGRTGFARLILREQVTVVPMVTAGAQEMLLVLSRGEGLARLLGLKQRLRANAFPIVLSIPWGLTSGFLPYLPLPTQITTAFLPPMRWPDLGPEAADQPAAVRRVYHDVEAVMQAKLDQLTRGRVPVIG